MLMLMLFLGCCGVAASADRGATTSASGFLLFSTELLESQGGTPFDKERSWSCCLQTDPLARGCIVSTVNPDAYNFASIS